LFDVLPFPCSDKEVLSRASPGSSIFRPAGCTCQAGKAAPSWYGMGWCELTR
jgi:hypothetical protein